MELQQANQFVLEPDEEYDKFCGKVFLTTKNNIIVHCLMCETKYNDFENYVNHIKMQHISVASGECLDEESLESEDDEESQSMHEEELPIDLLQEKVKINVERKSTSKAKEVIIPTEIEIRSRPTQIISSEKGVLTCPHCPERFLLEYSLRAHVKKEHEQKNRRFKCNFCGLQCETTGILQTHLRRHEKNKPHKCTECDRSFVYHSELQYHMRNHTGEKPYQCEDCGMRYAYQGTLKLHRKRHHTFEKDYVCPICGEAFYRGRFLRDHVFKHTNEPSYECEKCGKKFNHSTSFAFHKKKHHKEEQKREQEKKEEIQVTVDEQFVNVVK